MADPGPIPSAFGRGRRPRPPAATAGVKRTTPVEYRPHPISTAGVELSPEILELTELLASRKVIGHGGFAASGPFSGFRDVPCGNVGP